MASIGKLSVRVYVTQAEIPIEGATVVVTCRSKAGKYDLLSVQATNSSGMIRPVEVVTPDLYESTSPSENGAMGACVQCSVWAEHPGYAMLQVNGVQIFPGVETVQEMELVPLAEGQDSLQRRDHRVITPQDL